jgi:transcriptional regulator with XRE-family HTH domain
MKRKRVISRLKKRRGLPLLKNWRAYRNHMKQEDLADRSGLSQGLISHLENGKSDYSGETLEKLAFALQCEPADIIMRDPLDTEAPWSIWETLGVPERRQAVEILKALKRASGE